MKQLKKMFDNSNLPINIVIALVAWTWITFLSVLLFL